MFIWHFKGNELLHRSTKEIILKRSLTGGAYLPSENVDCHSQEIKLHILLYRKSEYKYYFCKCDTKKSHI